MREPQQDSERSSGAVKFWACVRFALGVGQMAGSITAAIVLFRTGINSLSLGMVCATCLMTTTSVLLFGGRSQRR